MREWGHAGQVERAWLSLAASVPGMRGEARGAEVSHDFRAHCLLITVFIIFPEAFLFHCWLLWEVPF